LTTMRHGDAAPTISDDTLKNYLADALPPE
jgi:hypothetical protein